MAECERAHNPQSTQEASKNCHSQFSNLQSLNWASVSFIAR